MLQTAMTRIMAITLMRRVDGIFEGRRSNEPQVWLMPVLLRNRPISIRSLVVAILVQS